MREWIGLSVRNKPITTNGRRNLERRKGQGLEMKCGIRQRKRYTEHTSAIKSMQPAPVVGNTRKLMTEEIGFQQPGAIISRYRKR
jgi:hypothetical protein